MNLFNVLRKSAKVVLMSGLFLIATNSLFAEESRNVTREDRVVTERENRIVRDNSAPRFVRAESVDHNRGKEGFYLGLNAGMHFWGNRGDILDNTSKNPAAPPVAFNGSLAVGYHLGNNFRVELEGGYDGAAGKNIFGFLGGYYDYYVYDNIGIFTGGGFGFATNLMKRHAPNGTNSAIIADKTLISYGAVTTAELFTSASTNLDNALALTPVYKSFTTFATKFELGARYDLGDLGFKVSYVASTKAVGIAGAPFLGNGDMIDMASFADSSYNEKGEHAKKLAPRYPNTDKKGGLGLLGHNLIFGVNWTF